jgi:hypothetical protein
MITPHQFESLLWFVLIPLYRHDDFKILLHRTFPEFMYHSDFLCEAVGREPET